MLRKSYNWMMSYAKHPKALWALVMVSFAESSFFPLPPDPLYVAMILANNKDTWRLAWICTISSVIGGIVGYYIGFGLYETVGERIVAAYGLENGFVKFQQSFDKWGFWIVALKGLTPIPFKVVAIFSGVAKMDMLTFLSASMLARGFRFFSIAALLHYCGPQVRSFIEKHLILATILVLLALVGGFYLIKYL
jgi:Predicted membrane protein